MTEIFAVPHIFIHAVPLLAALALSAITFAGTIKAGRAMVAYRCRRCEELSKANAAKFYSVRKAP